MLKRIVPETHWLCLNGNKLRQINMLEFIAIRTQLMKEYKEGYSLLFEDKHYPLTNDGEFDYPANCFKQLTNLYGEYFRAQKAIKEKKNARND